MKNTGLKPCPFCGERAYLRKTGNGYSNSYFTITAQIECRECKFYMTGENKFDIDEFMNIHILDGNDGINKMIEKWNRRV